MPYAGTLESAAEELAEAIERSVAVAVDGIDRAAVAFSGGLDSSVLVCCAKKVTGVVACSASVEGARDEEMAREAAAALGVQLVATRLTPESVSQELGAIKLPFEPSVMDASLWCLYSIVARSASSAGAKAILLGQLADELFGGYSKYRRALAEGGEEKAAQMMMQDVEGYAGRGRARDTGACSRWLSPRFPFESREVVQLGLALPVSYRVGGDLSKPVLRKAAVILGVPSELTSAPKKAAQYSSGVQKLVARTSLFNARRATRHHDSIATAQREAGGVQATAGEVQLLRPGRRNGSGRQAGSGEGIQAAES